jgi:hypothetical protein
MIPFICASLTRVLTSLCIRNTHFIVRKTTQNFSNNCSFCKQSSYKLMNYKTFSTYFFLARSSHTWDLLPHLEHRAEFPQFLDQGVCRTPWTGDQLVARPLPVHKLRETHTYTNTKCACPEWDSNPWSRLPSERRQCTRWTARLPRPAFQHIEGISMPQRMLHL